MVMDEVDEVAREITAGSLRALTTGVRVVCTHTHTLRLLHRSPKSLPESPILSPTSTPLLADG